MNAPSDNQLICPVTLNSTILILIYLYPKCCEKTELFSSTEGKCVSMDSHLQDKAPTRSPDLTKFKADVGFPCLNSMFKTSVEGISCDYTVHQASKENKTNPWNGEQYCWDTEKETYNSILIMENCQILLDWCIILVYCVSLLLVIITFFLYVLEPELRKNIKDKCFIYYLANLTIQLTCWGLIIRLYMSYFGTNFGKKPGILFLGLVLFYSFLSAINWLNVMCVHMWRTVKTPSSIAEKNFNVYVWYAQGLPVILFILFFIDASIFGEEIFLHRLKNGGVLSNPGYLYFANVIAIQQIINICIFIHVGYIIWNQKQQWKRSENHAGNQRIGPEEYMFSKLVKLFITVSFGWICIALLTLYNIDSIILLIFALLGLFPGFPIFIIYILSDRHVITLWKKRVGFNANVLEETVNPPLTDTPL